MLTRPGFGLASSVIAGNGNSCSALIASACASMCGAGPVGANPVVTAGFPDVSKVQPPIEKPPNVVGGWPGDVSTDVGPPATMMLDPSRGSTGSSGVPGLDQPGTEIPGPLKCCGTFGCSWITPPGAPAALGGTWS